MHGDITLGELRGCDPEDLVSREWLVTNGLGGYASGTVLGPPTRKYHGFFVPNLAEPNGRHVLLSVLEETLHTPEGDFQLGGCRAEDGRIDCPAAAWLEGFALEAGIPVWTWRLGGRRLRRSVTLSHGHNVLCARYELEGGHENVRVSLRPYFVLRRHDEEPGTAAASRAEASGRLVGRNVQLEVRMVDSPVLVRLGLSGVSSTLRLDPLEKRMLYSLERDRGYAALETHYSPAVFEFDAPAAGAPFALLVSLAPRETMNVDPTHLFEAERRRVERLLEQAGSPDDELAARLVVAADQFIVRPGNRPEEELRAEAAGSHVRTVIAGYHWFGDWGRDTMISFEGLTLSTGRVEEAAAILTTFAGYVKDGLLPNLFPEGAREALYHTVDATLWYFHAIDRYVTRVGDLALVRQLMPVLESICDHYRRGTHYGIGVDASDGLVRAGAPGYQLTWMDAKAGDWVVTPRRGKPVEIQALWYNALLLMASWREALGLPAGDHAQQGEQARISFNRRYWNPAQGCLRDVCDTEHGGDDDSGRPNQIFALSLRHAVLDEEHRASVLDYVGRHLLTPYGLRTLVPGHPDYKPNYHGDLLTRDGAYHQGTVWPWLIGHYVDALIRVRGASAITPERDPLAAFPEHLKHFGVGSIAEIFDAEAPYRPRGCIAQAWSVAEVLRARLRYSSGGRRSEAR